jgi:hypothetical protein
MPQRQAAAQLSHRGQRRTVNRHARAGTRKVATAGAPGGGSAPTWSLPPRRRQRELARRAKICACDFVRQPMGRTVESVRSSQESTPASSRVCWSGVGALRETAHFGMVTMHGCDSIDGSLAPHDIGMQPPPNRLHCPARLPSSPALGQSSRGHGACRRARVPTRRHCVRHRPRRPRRPGRCPHL